MDFVGLDIILQNPVCVHATAHLYGKIKGVAGDAIRMDFSGTVTLYCN